MRKILLIMTIVFLSNFLGFAQGSKKIDERVFNNLVDYVNCRYTNQYAATRKSKNDTITYKDKIKPELDKCTLNEHLSYDDLYNLLKNNSWEGTAERLVKTWRSKKEFSNVSDKKNSKIIEYIVDITGFNTSIDNNFKETIKGELLAAYPDSVKASYSMANYKAKYDSLKGKIDSSKTTKKSGGNPNEPGNKFNPYEVFQWLMLLVLVLINIMLIIKNRTKRGQGDVTREDIIRTVLESERIASRFKPITPNYEDEKLSKVINDKASQTANKLIEVERQRIESRVIELIKEALKNRDENPIPPQQEISNSDVKYLKEREDMKLFKEVAKENAYYEIFNIQGNIASYRFCGNESRAMSYYDSILKDVFDDEKSYSFKAKRIINGKEGTVELQLDGKWEIKTLAKIKFE